MLKKEFLDLLFMHDMLELGTWEKYMYGFSVPSFARLVAYPIDTLQRRQQMMPELLIIDAISQDSVMSLWNGASINILAFDYVPGSGESYFTSGTAKD